MNRRIFVGGALVDVSATAESAAPQKVKPGDIPTITFGKTGIQVSVLAKGGARMDLWPNVAAAAAHVRTFGYPRRDRSSVPVSTPDPPSSTGKRMPDAPSLPRPASIENERASRIWFAFTICTTPCIKEHAIPSRAVPARRVIAGARGHRGAHLQHLLLRR